MDKSKFLRVWEAAALMSLSICLCAAVWAQGRQERLSAGLVRLHVLAVSDSEQEQKIKLNVRDAVLEYITPMLENSQSREESEKLLNAELDAIREAAISAAEGREVTVTLGKEHYPKREYEGFTLPAGSYDSLRVVLGEGKGKNWWCIVYPPVCLSAVQSEELRETMNADDYALVTQQQGYEIRFRAVELWGEIRELMRNEE